MLKRLRKFRREEAEILIPFGTETVSLIQRIEHLDAAGRTHVGYALQILTGCSWRHTAQLARADNAISHSCTVTCRIPASQVMPVVGDYLILGVLTEAPQTYQQLHDIIQAHRTSGAFCIASITNNSRPGMPMPHYAARGDVL